jgi:hypothetical protein
LSFCGGAQAIRPARTRAEAAETARRNLFIGETFRWVGSGAVALRLRCLVTVMNEGE